MRFSPVFRFLPFIFGLASCSLFSVFPRFSPLFPPFSQLRQNAQKEIAIFCQINYCQNWQNMVLSFQRQMKKGEK